MFAPRIKLDKELYERVCRVAEVAGYSSADEFIHHLLEKELDRLEGDLGGDEPQERQKLVERLKGLGYL